MEWHQFNGAPIHATPQEIRNAIGNISANNGWGQIHRERRVTMVKNVVAHYSVSNRETRKESIRALLASNDWVQPAAFYNPQNGTDWERLTESGKIEKLDHQFKYFLKQARTPLDNKRRCAIDFILYSKIHEWYDPGCKDPKDRLKCFNSFLTSLGFQPLYLFCADEFWVQLSILLDWTYPQYLEHLNSPLKRAIDEVLPSKDTSNAFTGHAEGFLYRITSIGQESDPPFDQNAEEEITAWSFFKHFKHEFGRSRISAYYVMFQLLKHSKGEITESLKRNRARNVKTASITEKILTDENYAYLMGQKDLALNLAKTELYQTRIAARDCYLKAKEIYHKSNPGQPVPGPIDLALQYDPERGLREYLVERLVNFYYHQQNSELRSAFNETFSQRVNALSPEAKRVIDQNFLEFIEDVYSSKAQPTQESKIRAEKAAASQKDAAPPEGHQIEREVLLHEKDVTKQDLINLFLFHLNADQLRSLLPPPNPFWGYDQIETANAIVLRIDEILNELGMPPIHANSSATEFLLLSALYNGVDYEQLASGERTDDCPLKKIFFEVFSPEEFFV